MKRLLGPLVAGLLLLGLAPAALAQDGMEDLGHVLVSINGPVEVAEGERTEVLVAVNASAGVAGTSETAVVINGDAEISGATETVVVVNGDMVLEGADVSSVVVIGGTATIGAGTVVSGDVMTVNGTATVDPGATVSGEVRDIGPELAALGIILVPALLLFAIGAALVTIVVALFIAALASRQVRAAEWLISNEPGPSLLFGFLGVFILPLLGVLALITVIGAPIGLVFLFSVLPTLAYFGWIVAAIWLGDWVLGRTTSGRQAERPYLAAVLGVILLGAIGLIPVAGSIAGLVASLFGLGSLLLLGWRTYRREPVPGPSAPAAGPPAAQPAA
jgi:hypothetical protein